MKRSIMIVALVGAVAVLGGAALAAPTPAFTSPEDGATLSKAGGAVAVTGTGGFLTPLPSERSVFLRYDGSGTSCGQRYISETDGPDAGNGCSVVASPPIVPSEVEGTFASPYVDTGEIAYPLTIDASRNIGGTIAIASVTPNAMVFDVRVRLGNETVTQTVDAGPYAGTWFLDGPVELPVSIDIPDALDKVDVTSMQVDIVWRQWVNVAASTWIEHEEPASFLTIPTYTASFSRSVKVSVDDPTLSQSAKAVPVTLGEDGTFSGTLDPAALAAGDHRLYLQSQQGTQKSVVQSIGITVTE